MAKFTIEEIPQPKPPRKFILEMDETEAGTLMAVIGSVLGTSPIRMVTGALYHTLLGDTADSVTGPADSLWHSDSYKETRGSICRGRSLLLV